MTTTQLVNPLSISGSIAPKDASLASGSIDPSSVSTTYNIMVPLWRVIRSVYGGTTTMRSAAREFLPQYEREDDKAYERRLASTTLFNVLADSVQVTSSRPFAKPIKYRSTSHDYLRALETNIDSEGLSLNGYGRRGFQSAMLDGLTFTLVDYTELSEAETLADQYAASARPYFYHIDAADMIAVYSEFQGGRRIITHARFKEKAVVLDGFEEQLKDRIRCLWPGRYELWERSGGDSGEYQLIQAGEMRKAGGVPWDRVPIDVYYAGAPLADFVIIPPFLDLAYVNIRHWQSTSHQVNILDKSRFPMLAASGIDPLALQDRDPDGRPNGRIVLGPHAVLASEDPHARWYYVEPRGSAIEQGRKELDDLVNQMRALGLEPLLPKQLGAVTATERSIDEIKSRSILEQWSLDYVDHLERCSMLALEWVGVQATPDDVRIEMNTDFSVNPNPTADLDLIVRTRMTGDISRETLWSEMQRRNILSQHFDPDEEAARIQQAYADQLAMLPGAYGAGAYLSPSDPSQVGGGEPATGGAPTEEATQ